MLCGVPLERANQAYEAWRDRVNQPEDPPLVRAGRHYCLRQMSEYVDHLDVPLRLRAYMKRVIADGYAYVATKRSDEREPALELGDLTR